MKKVFLIANWKSNKNSQEAHDWLKAFLDITSNNKFEDKEIILCPAFTLLPYVHSWINDHKMQLALGAQDLSPFEQGAYTGEVNAKQVKEFADYTIIGHSERRINFKEDDAMLAAKVTQALVAGLTPIYCIQNENTVVPVGVSLVAYEPPTAIGTGNPDTPENAQRVAGMIINKYPNITSVLYGGSVTSANIRSFVQMEHISGALIGAASLDALKFTDLIKNASL